ncbi:unnamed protein product [Heligmosomoides polygyrus]|uniref:Ubiquitin-like domain-containing protein n=1 Tax=Heligmosomoides polygyrus TaxID=6339 RepID=A0A183F349_HELPZ|nr:unnamed protein product [Heligmosomoides polygyrus]
MLALDFKYSHTAIGNILQSVSLKLGKWVPPELTLSRRKKHVDATKELLDPHKQELFLHRLVTRDEKWTPLDNRRRASQCLERNRSRYQHQRLTLSKKKVMLFVWWCREGVVFWKVIEGGSSINTVIDSSQLDRMLAELRQNRFQQLFRSGIILQQDNARIQVAIIHLTAQTVHRVNTTFSVRCSTSWLEDELPMRTKSTF